VLTAKCWRLWRRPGHACGAAEGMAQPSGPQKPIAEEKGHVLARRSMYSVL